MGTTTTSPAAATAPPAAASLAGEADVSHDPHSEKHSSSKDELESNPSNSPPSLAGDKTRSATAAAVPDALSNDLAVPASKADALTGTTEVELVKGQPVIRNGMDVSRFIVSIRDDDDPAVTFRGMLLGTAFTAFASIISMLYVFKPYQVSTSCCPSAPKSLC